MTGSGGAERRRAARLDAWLAFRIDGRETDPNDYVHDLSPTGAFVRTLKPFPVRSRLRLSIIAPRTRRPFSFDAEVMRVIEPSRATDESPPGMGIAFLDLGAGDPRPKAAEILDEIRRLEADPSGLAAPTSREVSVPAAPTPELDAGDIEDVTRLEQFLAQARKQNLYDVLGADPVTATPASIQALHARRSKDLLPERFRRIRSPEIQAKVEEARALLEQALETLADSDRRDAYDRQAGIKETATFRRAAARARFEEARAQLDAQRLFAATIGFKVALSLDPGNPDYQRALDTVERMRRFFLS